METQEKNSMDEMLNLYLETLKFETIYTIATFGVALVFYRSYRNYKLLLAILCLNTLTEVTALHFIIIKKSIIGIYNFNFIVHQALWLYLLISTFKKQQKEWLLLGLFLGFSLVNLLFIEKSELNYYTFILGGFCYLIYFMLKSVSLLNQEALQVFKTNTFVLLSAPLLYYVGFMFTLGFRDSTLRHTDVLGKDLYSLISLVVNTIYYSVLLIYIYKSRKSHE